MSRAGWIALAVLGSFVGLVLLSIATNAPELGLLGAGVFFVGPWLMKGDDMNWRKFRCYACHKRWNYRTASVVYRSPEDTPLVVAGYVCKHCGTMFLIADRLIEGVAETLATLDKHNAARLS